MKTIAISGASGFVGQSLVDFFSKQNYKVVQIKRDILNNSTFAPKTKQFSSHIS